MLHLALHGTLGNLLQNPCLKPIHFCITEYISLQQNMQLHLSNKVHVLFSVNLSVFPSKTVMSPWNWAKFDRHKINREDKDVTGHWSVNWIKVNEVVKAGSFWRKKWQLLSDDKWWLLWQCHHSKDAEF